MFRTTRTFLSRRVSAAAARPATTLIAPVVTTIKPEVKRTSNIKRELSSDGKSLTYESELFDPEMCKSPTSSLRLRTLCTLASSWGGP